MKILPDPNRLPGYATKTAHVTRTALFVVLPSVVAGVATSVVKFITRSFRR